MNIKKIIKYSFVLIIVLVSLIAVIYSIVLYQIKENDFSKKNISQLVSLQEDMNILVKDTINTTRLSNLNTIKLNFIQKEKNFEKIKDSFILKDKNDFMDKIFNDIHKNNSISNELNILFQNEKQIEELFDKIYQLQIDKIKFTTIFNQIYPTEKQLRSNLEQIILNTNNIKLVKIFGDLKYYSKETLYQHKNNDSLSIWLKQINLLKEHINGRNLEEYYNIVKKIGLVTIKIQNTKNEENDLTNEILKIINKNKELNYEIEKDIENFTYSFIKNINFILTLLLISTITFIIIFAYKVSRNVGLSVDEIESKIEDGLLEIKQLNENLEQKVLDRTKQLTIQTNKVNDLLNNSSQGFLSFDKDFLIDEEYSLECENLLSKDLKNKNITHLLFQDNLEKIKFFKETMTDALEAKEEITSSLILSLLPKEILLNRKIIQLDYKILSNNKFMLILTNITDKKKLESKIKKEQRNLKMIVSVVSDTSLFYEAKKDYESFVENYKNSINGINNLLDFYNIIHTFKGLFSQLYMNNTVKELHNLESNISLLINKENSRDEEFIQLIEDSKLDQLLKNDINILTETLGKEFINNNSFIQVDIKSINSLEKKLLEYINENSYNKSSFENILSEINKLKYKTIKKHIKSFSKNYEKLALNLDKEIYPFKIEEKNMIYVNERLKPFINSLVHVFRNSCDHGIETKEERFLLEKDEVGMIKCSISVEDGFLILKISDDGKGIDKNIIKEKIIEKGIRTIDELNKMEDKEIMNFIFHPQFSSKEFISTLSGRGTGLYAVKEEVNKLEGEINIETTLNKGTIFNFKIPIKKNEWR